MPGAFSPFGPWISPQTPPDERLDEAKRNVIGAGASAADPMGMVSLLGPDSIAQILRDAQAGGSPLTNLLGGAASPVGAAGYIPKTTGALAGLGAFFGGSDTAEAKAKKKKAGQPEQVQAEESDDIKTLVDKWKDKDPSLLGLYSTYADNKKASRANVQGVDKASADEVRRRANEDADKALQGLMARIEKLDPPKQTFQQRYGKLAEAWPWLQAGTGIGVGMLMGGKARMSDDMFKYGPWKRSLDRFDEAINPNPGMISRLTGSGNNPSRAYTEAERIKGFADNIQPKSSMSGVGMPVLAGGTASAEVGMLPDAYNLKYAPQDSEDYKRAEQHLSGAGEALKAYGPMVALSALGAATGGKVVGAKDKQPGLMARSQPALERLGTGARSERSANFRGSVQDDIDLANMGRPQSAALPAPQPAGPTSLTPSPGGQALLPPPAGAPAPAAPAASAAGAPTATPKPPKPPRAPAPKQKDLLSEFEKGLQNLEKGKPFAPKGSFMRGKDQAAKDRVMKGAENLGLTSPNASPDDVARARKLLGAGNLKLGVAGAATGYSAILAERLMKLQEDAATE